MKTRSINQPARLKFSFVAAALILLFLSIFSYERVQQQKSSAQWVERAYLIKLKLKEAFAALRDAEAVQEAYILTRDSTLLERFVSSIATIPEAITQLDSLIIESQQQHELQTFAGLLQRRIVSLNAVIDSAEKMGGSELYHFLMESRDIADRTRASMSIMEKREDDLLRRRIDERDKQERLASVLILLFSISSLSILVYSFFKLRKESSLRSQSEVNAALLEEKVALRTAEIRRINEELNAKNKELERKNEELSSFTYIASHDLKEPLRKISLFADRIARSEEDHLTGEGKKYLERIVVAIRRMQSLIDSVFSYSRTETPAAYQATDLQAVAAQAIDLLQETIDEKKAVVHYRNLPVVYALPEQMEQLFVNLISNSLKYARPGITPRIDITARYETISDAAKKHKGWSLAFKDNGIGFDEQYKDKIFQIFQRLHGNEEYTGTGIGLAICKKIAENHNGFIDAQSEKGKGSVFIVFIPDHRPAMDKEVEASTAGELRQHS